VSSPLTLAPSTSPLPNFKYHLPKLFANGTILVNQDLISFSNAFHNIRENNNDICVRLFFNCLEEKVATNFFESPPKIFSTWDELFSWFKSRYIQAQILGYQLKDYNNLVFNKAKTIKYFNLCFKKL
jgi:hypothetical protein